MIIITDYQPSWPLEFERIKSDLTNLLGDLALRIDHIGSTSVPGLGAKDVIDIQVTVRELTPEIETRLAGAGYAIREGMRDHVPAGEDASPHLWAKLLVNQRAGDRPANIHTRKAGNPNQRYAILFRDYLRAHPHSATTVALIKREIAKRHADDVEAYYDIKDPVYDLIWNAAQDWAGHTGWQL